MYAAQALFANELWDAAASPSLLDKPAFVKFSCPS
jgi:hypothetical protein